MDMIQLVKYTGNDGQVKDFRLLEKIQGHWKDIGILMGIENATLESFEHKWQHRYDDGKGRGRCECP